MTTKTTPRLGAHVLRSIRGLVALALLGPAACGGSATAVDAAGGRDTPAFDAPTTRFAPKVDFATGHAPNAVALGDLNGDGKLDIVAVDYDVSSLETPRVSVLTNTTTGGTPSFAAKLDFGVGLNPHAAAIDDFNGDGTLDLAVTNSNAASISVLLGTTMTMGAPPSFAPSVELATGDVPEIVASGDLDGDGKPDLAVVNFASSTVSVLLDTTPSGATTPSFSDKTDFITGLNPEGVALGDFNGDGKLDLAVANGGSNTTSIYLNTTASGAATPSFAPRTDVVGGSNPNSVAIGDFNDDGKDDFVVVNFNSGSVTVFLNTTPTGALAATFAAGLELPTGFNPSSVAVADLDNDGHPDFVVANGGTSTVSVFMNTTPTNATTASFAARVDFATGADPESIAIGDVNLDGKLDLVTANVNDSTVSVLLAE